MTWDAMIRDEELHRRRALARFTKVQLIDLIVEAERHEVESYRVHNHGPDAGRGLDCREAWDSEGKLRGACMTGIHEIRRQD
ncbi:hypothetical protein [uncultured Microbacterium sp.]|uniref:hypothetical protein n=1 Tax=uncultured Microbacterium sp. TaxID=191216 RepID=UPI0026276398|nr:hypothetical protein [uncultured Microbacterium sp.]